MELIRTWLPDSPLVALTILLLVISAIPPIFERLRLPGLVGLLVAGVVLGEHGLAVSDVTTELINHLKSSFVLFAEPHA